MTVIPDPAPVQLLILRGLPGSGKSTLASVMVRDYGFVHLEADQFLLDAEGRYHFDPARVADAHAVCQQRTFEALQRGQRVVVANTHVRLWELAPYLGLAQLCRVTPGIVECDGAWENIHGVSKEVIAKMREKWEPLPAHLAHLRLNWPEVGRSSSLRI